MPINFPSSPTTGQTYEEAGRSWTWDGIKWNAQAYVAIQSAKDIRSVSTNTTLLLNDKNNIISFSGSSLQTLTVADVLEPGESVVILQLGSGQVRVSAEPGVSLSSSNSLFGTSGQNTQLEILCVSSSQYLVVGETSSVTLATGGTVYSDGSYVYHTFTGNGTLTVASTITADVLIVAGGGASSIQHSGGAGAGGVIMKPGHTIAAGSYPIVVGAGGTVTSNTNSDDNYRTPGQNGNNTTFSTFTALGGGGSRPWNANVAAAGSSGGSGGAGIHGGTAGAGLQPSQSGDSGLYGFGNASGVGSTNVSASGGGAGSAGLDGEGATGGAGKYFSQFQIAGTNSSNVLVTNNTGGGYFGGGGGAGRLGTSGNGGSGGVGGGGGGVTAGQGYPPTLGNGLSNTGGGGGGSLDNTTGGNGGSGIVIVRYTV